MLHNSYGNKKLCSARLISNTIYCLTNWNFKKIDSIFISFNWALKGQTYAIKFINFKHRGSLQAFLQATCQPIFIKFRYRPNICSYGTILTVHLLSISTTAFCKHNNKNVLNMPRKKGHPENRKVDVLPVINHLPLTLTFRIQPMSHI